MKLSESQEAMITRYLRDVALCLDPELPREQCEAGLTRIESLINRQLKQLSSDTLETADVEAVLRRLGAPEDQAAALVTKRAAGQKPAAEKIWLGVCHSVATRFGVDPFLVRAFFCVFGVTGPLALLTYLLGYVEGRVFSRTIPAEPINWGKLTLRVLGIFGGMIALRWVTGYAITGLNYGVLELAKRSALADRSMPNLGEWGWLQYDSGDLFALTFFCAIPLALLSALPVPPGWDYTLKRCAQAIVALYGIMLSYGLASMIVGIVLDFIGKYTG